MKSEWLGGLLCGDLKDIHIDQVTIHNRNLMQQLKNIGFSGLPS